MKRTSNLKLPTSNLQPPTSNLTPHTLYIYVVLTLLLLLHGVRATAQDNVVQNRPYTDLRPLHFGIVAGANMQDTKFNNVGLQTITYQDGTQAQSLVTCDQSSWDMGFNVGVLMEARINQYFAFRLAPQLYFGNRHLTFYKFNDTNTAEPSATEQQDLRTVYVGADCDIIYAAKRWGNHRPYVMAGLAPMINIAGSSSDYVQLKKGDLFLEVGIGCDFYLPFFKLRPEIKFMYGLLNALNTGHKNDLRDETKLPFAAAADRARSKMFVLSFYFE